MKYIKRTIENALKQYLTGFPVVAITGPRQSGKSTLLKQCAKNYTYITFDDYKISQFFKEDPEKFMSVYNNHVIFDEAQKVPELFNYIKIAVDNDRQNYGKYIITGSNQFELVESITESLAGRIGLLSLLPFDSKEIPDTLIETAPYLGTYPELVTRKYTLNEAWYSNYITTYLDKDVRQLHNIGDLNDFRKFLELLAANTSQIFTQSTYAKKLGVSIPTIKRWTSILESSYIIFLLPPYHNNLGKRIVKSPKLYFYDTGLVAYLTGIKTEDHYLKGPLSGPLFENYIITEILKNHLHQGIKPKLYFYRTNHGKEIDLIIDNKESREIIEIKLNATFKISMVETIESFLTEGDTGYLLYSGKEQPYIENCKILNFKTYLKR